MFVTAEVLAVIKTPYIYKRLKPLVYIQVLYTIKNITKNWSSLIPKTSTIVFTILEISSYTFTFTANLIYTPKKKALKL